LTNKLILPKPRTEYLKEDRRASACRVLIVGLLYGILCHRLLRECNSLGAFKKKAKAYFSSLGSHTAIL